MNTINISFKNYLKYHKEDLNQIKLIYQSIILTYNKECFVV